MFHPPSNWRKRCHVMSWWPSFPQNCDCSWAGAHQKYTLQKATCTYYHSNHSPCKAPPPLNTTPRVTKNGETPAWNVTGLSRSAKFRLPSQSWGPKTPRKETESSGMPLPSPQRFETCFFSCKITHDMKQMEQKVSWRIPLPPPPTQFSPRKWTCTIFQ